MKNKAKKKPFARFKSKFGTKTHEETKEAIKTPENRLEVPSRNPDEPKKSFIVVDDFGNSGLVKLKTNSDVFNKIKELKEVNFPVNYCEFCGESLMHCVVRGWTCENEDCDLNF